MKILKMPTNTHISFNEQKLEQESEFKYLGSTLCKDGRCSNEISVRIGMAKNAFMKRKDQVTRNVSLSLSKRLLKTLVWSVLLYACQSWTLKKVDIKKIKAFEMCYWRRMMKVKWMDRITKEAVLKDMQEERSMMKSTTGKGNGLHITFIAVCSD